MITKLKSRLNAVRNYASLFFFVLGKYAKKRLKWLIAGFVLLSTLDLLGLSLIGPFVALAADPDGFSVIPGILDVGKLLNIESQFHLILLLGSAIFVVFIAKSIAGYYVNRAIITFALDHQRRTKLRLLEAYLRLPVERALEKNSSELLTAVNQHVSIFTMRTMIPILNSVSSVIFFVSLYLFLLISNPGVTLSLGALFLVIAIVYDKVFNRRIAAAGEDSLVAFNSSVKTISQAADGFKEIRVAGAEPFFISRLDRYSQLYAASITQIRSIQVIPKYAVETSIVGFVVALLLIGLAKSGGPSPELISTVGMFGFAAIRAMPSVNMLLSSASNLRFGYPALQDLHRDLDDGGEEVPPSRSAQQLYASFNAGGPVLPFEREVCVNNVSYTFPEKKVPALSDVSVCFKKGQTIGIIGTSGSGKTTLIDTLLGLLQPHQGTVSVDGVDIAGHSREWMNRIAYIPQSVFLLDDTIAANIAFGVEHANIDQERIKESLRLAQLSSFIESLPEGALTVVGERGTRLSGGQKQRVAIARAIYNQRDLLVMDEATAALDTETERDVVEAINELHGRVTMLVIAHRLTTLKYCDVIHRLEQGQVVESGSYDEIVGVGAH